MPLSFSACLAPGTTLGCKGDVDSNSPATLTCLVNLGCCLVNLGRLDNLGWAEVHLHVMCPTRLVRFPPIQLPGQPRQPFGILLRLRICRMGTPAIGILLPLRRLRGPRWCISSTWYQGGQGSGSPLLKSGPRKKIPCVYAIFSPANALSWRWLLSCSWDSNKRRRQAYSALVGWELLDAMILCGQPAQKQNLKL